MIRDMADEEIPEQQSNPEETPMTSPTMQRLMAELEDHRADTREMWLRLRAENPDVLGDRPPVDDLIASYERSDDG